MRILQVLLAVPGTVHPQDVKSALFQACSDGSAECLQCLLAAKIDPDVKDPSGNSPLHLAVNSGCIDTLNVLLEAGCDAECRGAGGRTPLHLSARLGTDDCLDCLARHGAKVNCIDSEGCTPLITAVKHGNYGSVQTLLRLKCNVNATDDRGLAALHYGCHKAQCVESLLSSGADPNIVDKDGNTAAMLAAAEGFSGVIKALIKANYDVNIQNSFTGRTVLHTVAMKGHKECIEELVLAGADINICDKDFKTPLWYAISGARFDVVKFLFRANSNVDKFQCPLGIPMEACPLHLALARGDLKVIRLFILTGYDSAHVRQSIEREEVKSLLVNEDLSHWIEHARGPLTLRQVCRMWIRHHQGRLLFHDLRLLPLPEPMKEFISLTEIDEEH